MHQLRRNVPLRLLPLLLIALILQPHSSEPLYADTPSLQWTHLSATAGDLPYPSESTQQTAALILDIDQDGRNDFVIAARRQPGPALVWFRQLANGWERYVVEPAALDVEAGGAYHDIDGDGDLDIVMGGDNRSNEVWWWENPAPQFRVDRGWTRHTIKQSGARKHHDQSCGDFDGDGQAELVFWNQRAKRLFLAEIPADPRSATEWPMTAIYQWSDDNEHEGLAAADMNGDGVTDIVGGGHWFQFSGDGDFTPHAIDNDEQFARAAVGQLIPGGAPEVVFGCGDCTGPLQWYEQKDGGWVAHKLLSADIKNGHSLALADFNGDGALDIFVAEMRQGDRNRQAGMWVLLGDNQGNFTPSAIATGYDNHESKVGDLNGDGTPDILGKPYDWQTPGIDIWLNQQRCDTEATSWQRHVIDEHKPWRTLFVVGGDLDGDGDTDIATGGWWYRNPGTVNGPWERNDVGAPLRNIATIYDFDGDGDLDLLGTQGEGNAKNAVFAWARNDGGGAFTVLTNIDDGVGDFLQGIAVGRWQADRLAVALSWHRDREGVQLLQVPGAPSEEQWRWQRLTKTSLHEALSAGDIDGDGALDLLLGTIWLRNDGDAGWQANTIHETAAAPDRNRLGDINGDGRLDAIVGYEAISKPGVVAWYEQPTDLSADLPTTWREHEIATVIGPMSLDVADMNGDGDLDVIVGEHNLAEPTSAALYVFENVDGHGGEWNSQLVYRGDEHHDGAQVLDIDGDHDLDIVSIGWSHEQLVLYENRIPPCAESSLPAVTPAILSTVPLTTAGTIQPVAPAVATAEPSAISGMASTALRCLPTSALVGMALLALVISRGVRV
ncbi:MAG: FG-GAP-like repeat-containing protein [Caldilineaceae bacterium]